MKRVSASGVRGCFWNGGTRSRLTVCGVLVTVWSLLSESGLAAQNIGPTSGTITGVVTDQSGAVLPGATLTATSPSLVGVQSVQTDGAGVFALPGLPTGTYRIEATLAGFAPAVAENVVLRVGDTLRVNFTLQVGIDEVVQVDAPLISAVTTERTNDLSAAELAELPKGRTWDTVVEVTPGVDRVNLAGQSGLSFQGASVNENVYVLDGVDTTRVTTGVGGQPVVFEFVEGVQVKSGFVSAEYGGALGGIVNVTTRSGSNTFHGFGTFIVSGSALEVGPRPRLRVNPQNSREAQYIQDPEDDLRVLEFGGTLSGPIVRDRLWFFGGYLPTFTDRNREVTFLASGQTLPFANRDRRHFGSGKITSRLTNALKVNASIQVMPATEKGRLPSYDGTDAQEQPFADLGSKTPQVTYALSADWVATPRLFVNAFAGYLDTRFRDLGTPDADRYRFVTSNIGMAGVPPAFQGPAGFQTFGNNIRTDKSDTTRFNLGMSATLGFNAAGAHTFKAGAQFASQEWIRLGGYTGKRVDVHWNTSFAGQRGTYGYWRAWDNRSDGRATSTNLAMFAQDTWTAASRVTLNLGLRVEREIVEPYVAATDTTTGNIEFGFGDKLAPRLGVAWDVRGDATWKIFANGGLFYDTLKLSLPGQAFGGAIFRIRYYTLDTFEWQSLDPDSPQGRLLFVQNLQGLPAQLDRDLKPTRTNHVGVGTEYQLGRSTVLGIQYSRRTLSHAVENFVIGDPRTTSRVTAIANPGRGIAQFPYGPDFVAMPEFERTYNGVEVVLEKRLSRNWAGSASYSYSRLRGNYEGLGDADEQAFGGGAINANRYCDYLEGCFTASGRVDSGPLTLDRPHQFKLNGIYQWPFGLSVGATFRTASGTIVTRQIGVNAANPVHPEGRGSDGRTPTFSQTNLQVQYRLPAFRGVRASAALNVINLFDQKTVVSLFPAMLLGASVGIPVPPQDWFAARVDYKAAIAASGSALDPRFLMPQAYQAPRSARVSLRFDF